jgi:hypothetical protein
MAACNRDPVLPRPNSKMRLRWHEMSAREQLVWAVTYAQSIGVPGALAYVADKAALSLRALAIDHEDRSPEYDLARANLSIERNEFDPWYRVACQISGRLYGLSASPSDDACAKAYERYRQSRTDFC